MLRTSSLRASYSLNTVWLRSSFGWQKISRCRTTDLFRTGHNGGCALPRSELCVRALPSPISHLRYIRLRRQRLATRETFWHCSTFRFFFWEASVFLWSLWLSTCNLYWFSSCSKILGYDFMWRLQKISREVSFAPTSWSFAQCVSVPSP